MFDIFIFLFFGNTITSTLTTFDRQKNNLVFIIIIKICIKYMFAHIIKKIMQEANENNVSFDRISGSQSFVQQTFAAESDCHHNLDDHRLRAWMPQPVASIGGEGEIGISTEHFDASTMALESVSNSAAPTLTPISETTSKQPRTKCASKELFTCVALSSVVIGLPIAIIIVLVNLPRLSTRRDTRQQHYILLAFGFPFSLVVIVSIIYAANRLVSRIRKGPDHSKYFRQSGMSWRQFSHRLARTNRRHSNTNSAQPDRYSSHDIEQPTLLTGGHYSGKTFVSNIAHKSGMSYEEDSYTGSCESYNDWQHGINEPKLYSLVTEIMSQQQQQPKLIATNQMLMEPCESAKNIAQLDAHIYYKAMQPCNLSTDIPNNQATIKLKF